MSANRVLHVIPSVAPCRGGPSEVIVPMVRALQRSGLDVDLVATNEAGPGTLDVDVKDFTDWAGTRVRFFPRYNSSNQMIREYAYSCAFASWMAQHARDYRVIHVHALFSFVCSAAMAAARRHRVPYVIRPLGVLGHWPLRQSAWKKKIYLALCDRGHLREAAAFHFTSAQEREEAAGFCPGERGRVIPHGIELPPLMPHAREKLRRLYDLPAEAKIALFLGRLHPKKGLDLLLPAVERLDDPALTVVLAGDGESAFVRELDREIKRRELWGKVRRVGHVAGETKELLLQGADMFVSPSRHENFGYAVLEALAAGTPVVTSDQVPLAADIRRFNLGRVATLDPVSLGKAMAEILSAPTPIDRGAPRGYVAANYSWRSNAEALIHLYDSMAPPKQKNVLGGGVTVSFNLKPANEHDHHVCPRSRRVAG